MPYTGFIGSGQRVTKTLTGAQITLTGNSGNENRTFDLPSDATADIPHIWINGRPMHLTSEFSFSSPTITIFQA